MRAYDVRSGALRWTFRTIPQPGEPGYETWPKDAWQYIGGANSWPGMTLDEKRGLVFVPTGSAASDFYGANRAGDNLYANCLLALEAATGKLRWHFQFVRHDVLDRDLPSAPTLITLRRKGKRVDALVQTTKQGFVFVLDRDTGKPAVPHRGTAGAGLGRAGRGHRPHLPATDDAGALRAPAPHAPTTSPRARPRPIAGRAPNSRRLRSDGPFKPLTIGTDTTIYPGFDGGAEWGGPAWDPDTGLLYVNANEMAWVGSLAPNDVGRSTGKSIYLRECAACHGDSGRGSPPQFPAVTEWRARMTRGAIPRARAQGRRPHAGVPQPAGAGARGHCRLSGRRRGPAGRRARCHGRQPAVSVSPAIGAGWIRKVIRPSPCPGAR